MTWGEAEIFVISKLRLGNHPVMIERSCLNMICETNDPRRIQYLDNICRILENLRHSGQFRDLPNYNEFRRIETHTVELAKFGVMMRGRFADGNRLRRYGMDDEMVREIGEFASEHPNSIQVIQLTVNKAKARALDREAEENLRAIREQERIIVEEKYKGRLPPQFRMTSNVLTCKQKTKRNSEPSSPMPNSVLRRLRLRTTPSVEDPSPSTQSVEFLLREAHYSQSIRAAAVFFQITSIIRRASILTILGVVFGEAFDASLVVVPAARDHLVLIEVELLSALKNLVAGLWEVSDHIDLTEQLDSI